MDNDNLNDPQFDAELSKLITEETSRINEQDARAQACAAHGMLCLLGELNFEQLNQRLKTSYTHDTFRYCAYSLAGLPVVQRAIRAAYPDLDSFDALSYVVKAIAILFKQDPMPLIAAMTGVPEAKEHQERGG